MKILILGSGGREHALAWRLAQTRGQASVFLHPGNAGTWRAGYKPLGASGQTGPKAMAQRARELGIELIVIGPEALLAEGYADALRELGFWVVGPNRAAAQLETSKVFAKEFMKDAGIPTAPFEVATSALELRSRASRFPVALKLDGLAAGKGVVIAHGAGDVQDFAHRVWEEREFGEGPHRIVVESFLEGVEVSYLGLCDGKAFIPLSSATDYKRVGEGNHGPNTGGMGVISPSPFFDAPLEEKVRSQILTPLLSELRRRTLDYRGALYVGLMVSPQGDPYVLEFNARFGDPETQALMLRLESDLGELLLRTAKGELSDAAAPRFSAQTAVYVVGAAENYPSSPTRGDLIHGLDRVAEGATVFFSGVKETTQGLVTDGGRVLGVGALGSSAEQARQKAYSALEHIHWRGQHFRRDIGLTVTTT